MSEGGRNLTVLITGFGPFPGAPYNPTGALVHSLARLRRPGLGDVRLAGHVFRTSYAAVDRELPLLIQKWRPDVVLMWGLASKSRFIRVETCARNSRSVTLPDAMGEGAQSRTVAVGGPVRLTGRAPFAPIVAALRRAGLPVRLSDNAGRYLCNYLYWRALESAGSHRPRMALFVHVPKLSRARRPRARVRRGAATAAELLRAGETVLRTLVAGARRP